MLGTCVVIAAQDLVQPCRRRGSTGEQTLSRRLTSSQSAQYTMPKRIPLRAVQKAL